MTHTQAKASEAAALLDDQGVASLPRPVVPERPADDSAAELEPVSAEEVIASARRPKPKRKPASVPRTPSKLARFLPDAERVKIWKRDLGKRGYVRDYSLRDLEHAQDVETFIQTYVVPTFGEGDYDVEAINTEGKVTRTITLSVMDPRKAPAGVSAADATLGPVVDRLLSRIDALERDARDQTPKSMVDQIREITQLQQLLGGNDGGKPADSGGLMTLWLMQQNQQSSSAPVASELAALRAELREIQRQAAAPTPPPPPTLPPPPPPPPRDTPIDIAALMREAMAANRPAFDIKELAALLRPERSPVAELTAALGQVAPLVERMFGSRSTELEQLRQQQLEQLRDQIRDLKSQPSRGIREVIDDMSAVSQFVNQARRGPQREEGFWSFLGNLVEQFPNTVESLSGLVDRIREDQAPAPAPTNAPKPLPGKRPAEFPDGFDTYVRAIENAGDDAGRIGATLAAFQKLGESPRWRAYLAKIMKLARDGQGDEALAFVRSFLEGLRDAGHLAQDTVTAAVQAFENHLARVLESLSGGDASR